MKQFGQNDPNIAQYAEDLFQPLDDILKEIVARSETEGLRQIQVMPMDGLHLEILTRAINAKKVVEIGTLGGYSGVCLCRGMGEGGRLYTFEMNPRNAQVAGESFRKAGFADQVEIHVGPALLNLPLIAKQGPFDLVFIDANKEDYPHYLNWAAANLKVGGVVLGDNTFAWGEIHDAKYDHAESPDTLISALRKFNQECAQGGRFRSTILPTGEGLTMGVKIR